MTGSRFGPKTAALLQAAFKRSRHPMLLADDQRRWVTGNAAACELLGVAQDELPNHTLNEFLLADRRLVEDWETFLNGGAVEGWSRLAIPDRGEVPVEFSMIANVLPALHLVVFVLSDLAP
jgi:PAS domain-containing protein